MLIPFLLYLNVTFFCTGFSDLWVPPYVTRSYAVCMPTSCIQKLYELLSPLSLHTYTFRRSYFYRTLSWLESEWPYFIICYKILTMECFILTAILSFMLDFVFFWTTIPFLPTSCNSTYSLLHKYFLKLWTSVFAVYFGMIKPLPRLFFFTHSLSLSVCGWDALHIVSRSSIFYLFTSSFDQSTAPTLYLITGTALELIAVKVFAPFCFDFHLSVSSFSFPGLLLDLLLVLPDISILHIIFFISCSSGSLIPLFLYICHFSSLVFHICLCQIHAYVQSEYLDCYYYNYVIIIIIIWST